MAISSVLPLAAQRLTGKVALITGAASGLGAAAAKLFARHGAKVVIADIQDKLGHSVVQEIGSDGSACFLHCDVSHEPSVRSAVDKTIAQHNKLDILFSNAGIIENPGSSIFDTDPDTIKRVFDTNVFGSFNCAKHAARVMVQNKTKGSILFTASLITETVIGIYPNGCPTFKHAYTASKHAIVGLTKGLGVELGQHGIRVNCISPYAVVTTMTKETMELEDQQRAEELYHEAANLKGVVIREDDVAEAALYLASDAAKYVSGVNLMVDGGYSTTNVAFEEASNRILASKN